MTPVKYDKACADCHALEFDPANYPDLKAPHDKPDVVRAFLRKTYAENPPKIVAKAAAAEEDDAGRGPRRRRGRADDEPKEEAGGAPGFKNAKAAEAAMFWSGADKTCLYCHGLSVPGAPKTRASCSQTKGERTRAAEAVQAALGERLPDVVPSNMQTRWLPHGEFSHFPHRPFTCTACHEAVRSSTKTADVLLPGIATCRTCHTGGAGVRAACVHCHTYHHKKKEGPLDGPLTLEAVGRAVRR